MLKPNSYKVFRIFLFLVIVFFIYELFNFIVYLGDYFYNYFN